MVKLRENEQKTLLTLQKLNRSGKVVEKAQLDKKFVTIALGWLHRKGWATLKEKNSLRTEKKTVPQGADEKLLSLLKERGSLTAEMLDKEMQNAVSILKGRKLLEG